MEINKIITIAAFATLAVTVVAQVQILGNGHVIVGDKNAVQPSQAMRIVGGYTTKDPVVPDTTFAMTVTSNGLNNTGGYIAFGSNGGVAIGETRLDNDVLNLIGKGGLTYTGNNAAKVFSYRTSGTTDPNFTFYCKVMATHFINNSDSRLKSDVRPMGSVWENLAEITPVSYLLHDNPPVADKEVRSAQTLSDVSDTRSYGFIAQEVQKVFPDLVVEREDGMLGIDYQGFIPMLVEAVNELKRTVDAQQATIEAQKAVIEEAVPSAKRVRSSGVDTLSDDTFSLGQNRPNPFSGTTVINCTLPRSVASASIGIYDLNGKQIAAFPVDGRGETSVTVQGNTLAPGLYIYVLIADGAEIDSKRMIVTD